MTTVTHLAIGLSIRACQAGHRVAFATAAQWVDAVIVGPALDGVITVARALAAAG